MAMHASSTAIHVTGRCGKRKVPAHWELVEHGVASVPVPAVVNDLDTWRAKVYDAIQWFPEYRSSYVADGAFVPMDAMVDDGEGVPASSRSVRPLTMHSVNALGNPSSFHNTTVRALRTIVHPVVKETMQSYTRLRDQAYFVNTKHDAFASALSLPMLAPWSFMQLVGQLGVQPVCYAGKLDATPLVPWSTTSIAKARGAGDALFAGWLNLDPWEHTFTYSTECCGSTRVPPRTETSSTMTVPSGHVLLFDTALWHRGWHPEREVTLPGVSMWLTMGWCVTREAAVGTAGSFVPPGYARDVVARMRLGAVMPVLGGSGDDDIGTLAASASPVVLGPDLLTAPTMYPRKYMPWDGVAGCTHRHHRPTHGLDVARLETFSVAAFPDSVLEWTARDSVNKVHQVVPRVMPSLDDMGLCGEYPAYSESELALVTPQLL